MRYLMFICGDGIPASDAEEELAARALASYVEESDPLRIYGHPLLGPETATTVRVRDGQTLLSDGPFVETKEHIIGFDLIECTDLEQAIRAAAAQPMAWFHRIEIRPLDPGDDDEWTGDVVGRLRSEPPQGKTRYLLMILTDAIESPAEREALTEHVEPWIEQHRASGARIVGQVLAGVSEAVTVRTRGPHTLVSDGPFAETKEFVGGFDVIECDDLDEAIAIAEQHPVSPFHAIEIRPLTPLSCAPSALGSRRRHARRPPDAKVIGQDMIEIGSSIRWYGAVG